MFDTHLCPSSDRIRQGSVQTLTFLAESCRKLGIVEPPWMPEELASAGGCWAGFRVVLMGFLCELFGACRDRVPER